MSSKRSKPASRKPAQAAPAPKQEIIAPKTVKLIDDGRKQSSSIIATLSQTAITIAGSDGAGDKVAVLERLWAMQKEAEDRQAEREFAVAKVAVAMELTAIPKNHKIEFVDKNNQKRETPYATRDDIESVLDPICQRHGLSKEYTTHTVDGKACQVLIVRHVGGHKEEYRSPYMPLDTTGSKNNNQAAGSTAEYGMRYALKGAFNIKGIDKDDDGTASEAGTGKPADKFAERVKGSGEQDIDAAADKLRAALSAATTKERRGEILMSNVKLLATLEEQGKKPVADELRKLAEEEPNG